MSKRKRKKGNAGTTAPSETAATPDAAASTAEPSILVEAPAVPSVDEPPVAPPADEAPVAAQPVVEPPAVLEPPVAAQTVVEPPVVLEPPVPAQPVDEPPPVVEPVEAQQPVTPSPDEAAEKPKRRSRKTPVAGTPITEPPGERKRRSAPKLPQAEGTEAAPTEKKRRSAPKLRPTPDPDASPATVEPVAVEPVAVEPVAVEPVAVGPVARVAVEPVAVEPVAVEPVALEPTAAPIETKAVEAKAEPKPEHKAEPKPEHKAEPKPEPVETKAVEAKAEPKPEPVETKAVEAKAEPKPEPIEEKTDEPTGAESHAEGEDRRRGRRRRADREEDSHAAVAVQAVAAEEAPPAEVPHPVEVAPVIPMLPDPAAAAFEAARIAGEIVGDIESASGAAIVAAAAAGAAIEAARARSRAQAEGEAAAAAAAAAAATSAPQPPPEIPPDPLSADPVTTVRMQRDRILRALAEDVAAQATSSAAAHSAAVVAAAASASPEATPAEAHHPRAPTHPPSAHPGAPVAADPAIADELIDDDRLDPVQIAAAAIQRLRKRARGDFASMRGHYQRHDLFVVVVALIVIIVAGRWHGRMTTPPTTPFPPRGLDGRGLAFDMPTPWLEYERLPLPPPRLLRDPSGLPPRSDALYVGFTHALEGGARIEVLIDKKPAWSNVVTALDLDRRTRYGELYKLESSSVRQIAGVLMKYDENGDGKLDDAEQAKIDPSALKKLDENGDGKLDDAEQAKIESVRAEQNWLRTEYYYTHASHKGDVPRVDRAIEYAIVDSKQLYQVTMFGSPQQLERLESVIAPSLRVQTRSGLPFVPEARSIGTRQFPPAIETAFASTVMVMVADLVDGRLQARGGGAGIIVGQDGSILTNYHVVHDKDGRLHDVFVIGRYDRSLDRVPKLTCAGRPNRGKLQREIDLALIKCDTDLDGRTWIPAQHSKWPYLAEARNEEVRMGQHLWVLGYPDVVGGGLTLSEGEVEGWTGTDGAQGRDFIKTDASITHGNSGGPVVNDKGRLVGIASASRTRIIASGSVVESAQVGLVRPLISATDLLAIAAAGWTPREGRTDPELQPTIEPRAEGIRIATTIVDASNGAPVRDALVMIMRPGVATSAIDVNSLDDQVIAWGRSNMEGWVEVKQPVPVPGMYTVMVIARGYEALVGDGALRLGADAPPSYDPWGKIEVRSR